MHSDLVIRARRGDDEAIEELLRRNDPPVRARIEAEIPQKWQAAISADDVMQHSWLEVFLRIGTLATDDEAGFEAWLYRAAQNNLRDAIRRLEADKRGGNTLHVHLPGKSASVTLLEALLGVDSRTPSRIASGREAERALHAALQELPQAYGLAVQRYDIEGRSIHEVAAELGRSAGAVHLLRVRAHEQLRGILSGKSWILGGSA